MSLILQMTSFVYFWLSYLFAFVDSLDLVVFVVPGGVKIWRQGCVSRMLYLDAYCRFVLAQRLELDDPDVRFREPSFHEFKDHFGEDAVSIWPLNPKLSTQHRNEDGGVIFTGP